MDINQFAKQFPYKMKEIEEFAMGHSVKDIIGVEAVNHFKENFEKEGFVDEKVDPWKDVERRDPNSPWYGHSGQMSKKSAERTSAPILTGETRELKGAIRYEHLPNGARIINRKPYARVHNEGLPAKIYGKKSFVMPKRPFIGVSRALNRKIREKIKRELIKIIKR